ncbi:hypothetical protein F383_29727 [Gossypium arboreum]|uniref:Uncharacterized protein n=1 Tax=Gossypium arboreum TaxID=29729 RepID=A0A0B0PJK4_GOSAR|nr:hypothetical protein F383_29727 [Gossypium arboreum]
MAKVYIPNFQQNILAYTCQNALLDPLRRKYQKLLAGVMTLTTVSSTPKWIKNLGKQQTSTPNEYITQ